MAVSPATRLKVVNSPLTKLSDSQRSDLLDEGKTDSNLVALLEYLIDRGHAIGVTACVSDHHDDSALNPTPPHVGTHAGGFAVDCWPLNTATAGDWVPADGLKPFLADAAAFPGIYQIGLAGTADTEANREATGLPYEVPERPDCFSDSGDDHLHLGVRPA